MNTSRPPPFWELGANPFQELCRDVLREDSSVKECHIYGKNGQSQFGIDQEAALHAGGYWAGQSKAYENLNWTDLRDAADDFWKNLARWKERGVTRFTILAGCGVDDTRTWEKLRRHPELTERLEAIVELTETQEGKLRTADEIEGMLVEEVRRIGSVAMRDWAIGAEEVAAKELQAEIGNVRLRKKKP